MLDKKAETRSNLIQSLFSFSEHEFYFVFPGLFHCYSRAMNIYVHHACQLTGLSFTPYNKTSCDINNNNSSSKKSLQLLSELGGVV